MKWTDISPADAKDINLRERTDITAPLNENGERCPWPWDPQQLVGQPIGQYHCPYCGAMVMAGEVHLDYSDGVTAPPVSSNTIDVSLLEKNSWNSFLAFESRKNHD